MSTNFSQTDYERIAQAIQYLGENYQHQPNLDDLALRLHLSPGHLQRLFRRWAGISPKRFVQFLTVEHAKKLLAASNSVLDAAYDTGLSGPSRLHDLFISVEAVTPGEYKSGGAGLAIEYGFHATPFGDCLLATTDRGICGLTFTDADERVAAFDELQARWRNAPLTENLSVTQPLVDRIFGAQEGADRRYIRLLLKGTNFQLKVWEALLRIPPGAACTYGDVAGWLGKPTAARAVGSAVGANAIGYLIPCHRVIRSSGAISDYRWGATRKKAILGWEAARWAANA